MFIKPTEEANGSLLDIHEDALDFLLYPANEDVPCPWDADVLVENGTVTVAGGMGPSNLGNARCVCTFKLAYFDQFYKVEVPSALAGDPSVLGAIEAAGWIEA